MLLRVLIWWRAGRRDALACNRLGLVERRVEQLDRAAKNVLLRLNRGRFVDETDI
jgi:hypothetical protein